VTAVWLADLRFEAKTRLRHDKDLYLMMQIAADKHCWLSDLDDVPAEEIALWTAYYSLENERHERLKQKAEIEGKRGR